MMRIANERMAAINAAFEAIVKERAEDKAGAARLAAS